jgi:(p)ppGpp synthase/HD superfamily hydrolase
MKMPFNLSKQDSGIKDYMKLVEEAREFSRKAHEGQKRKYHGEEYFVHPERVAKVAQELDLPYQYVMAAYLHDTVEDTTVTIEEVKQRFGEEVANHVNWLTNPSKKFPNLKRDERKKMDREHLAKAPDQVKILKALDRIDNVKDMVMADPGFKKKYANESLLLAEALVAGQPSETLVKLVNELKALATNLATS